MVALGWKRSVVRRDNNWVCGTTGTGGIGTEFACDDREARRGSHAPFPVCPPHSGSPDLWGSAPRRELAVSIDLHVWPVGMCGQEDSGRRPQRSLKSHGVARSGSAASRRLRMRRGTSRRWCLQRRQALLQRLSARLLWNSRRRGLLQQGGKKTGQHGGSRRASLPDARLRA